MSESIASTDATQQGVTKRGRPAATATEPIMLAYARVDLTSRRTRIVRRAVGGVAIGLFITGCWAVASLQRHD